MGLVNPIAGFPPYLKILVAPENLLQVQIIDSPEDPKNLTIQPALLLILQLLVQITLVPGPLGDHLVVAEQFYILRSLIFTREIIFVVRNV